MGELLIFFLIIINVGNSFCFCNIINIYFANKCSLVENKNIKKKSMCIYRYTASLWCCLNEITQIVRLLFVRHLGEFVTLWKEMSKSAFNMDDWALIIGVLSIMAGLFEWKIWDSNSRNVQHTANTQLNWCCHNVW